MPPKKAPKVDPKWIYKETDMVKYLKVPKQIFPMLRKRDRAPLAKSLYLTQKGKTTLYDEAGFGVVCAMLGLVPADCRECMENERVREEKEKGIKWGFVISNRVSALSNTGDGIKVQMCETGDEVIVTVGSRFSDNSIKFLAGMPVPVRDVKNGVGRLACKPPVNKGMYR